MILAANKIIFSLDQDFCKYCSRNFNEQNSDRLYMKKITVILVILSIICDAVVEKWGGGVILFHVVFQHSSYTLKSATSFHGT